ncbi:MAG: exopolysaccharide biosynthesis polyprenyl glycosylphosphotransferase [Vicinamibacteria bacterium]|jgi:exopolysaccharide biosynthesis polyprenyl glycosylphosphotransferase
MTSAELRIATRGTRRGLRALEAQRMIDLFALRLAPSAAAGLIAYSHMGKLGEGLIVFACVLIATQAIERSQLPLHVMPASRILLGLAAPLVGAAAAWLIAAAAGQAYPFAEYEAVVLGSWLVMALGAWIKARLSEGLRARVAVIGPREFAADFVAELEAANVRTYDVVGWVSSLGPAEYRRLRWLGTLDEVRSAVVDERIDLIVAGPGAGDAEGLSVEDVCARVAEECLDLPVRLIASNQLYEETFGHVPVGMIDAAWYRYIMHPRFRASGPHSKRVFDLVLGTVIGLLFLPVLVLAAIAIKLSDRGPIFYRQRRLGELGEEFDILKLRTMHTDAEANGPQWAAVADDRVTRVGRILRRSHVDEIPQLWNVLRGDMTLVGPRPERPEMVAELERRFPHYTRRHLVKPGIAGWAALRCGYAGSDIGTAWKLCHDLFYIKRRSMLADALILAETGVEVFRDAHRALRAPGDRFLLGEEPNA